MLKIYFSQLNVDFLHFTYALINNQNLTGISDSKLTFQKHMKPFPEAAIAKEIEEKWDV